MSAGRRTVLWLIRTWYAPLSCSVTSSLVAPFSHATLRRSSASSSGTPAAPHAALAALMAARACTYEEASVRGLGRSLDMPGNTAHGMDQAVAFERAWRHLARWSGLCRRPHTLASVSSVSSQGNRAGSAANERPRPLPRYAPGSSSPWPHGGGGGGGGAEGRLGGARRTMWGSKGHARKMWLRATRAPRQAATTLGAAGTAGAAGAATPGSRLAQQDAGLCLVAPAPHTCDTTSGNSSSCSLRRAM